MMHHAIQNIRTQENITDARIYSIDLLRIISMIMVVILHLNLFGGLIESANYSCNYQFKFAVNFYEQVCIVAVDVFVIISSWFLSVSTTFKTKRIINLIVQMFFWYFVATSFAYFLGVHPQLKDIIRTIPLRGSSYDFISGYLVMFLFSPFINKLTSNLSDRLYRILAWVTFVVFSLSAPFLHNGYLSIRGGYNFAWFICVYIIVGYIRRCVKWYAIKWHNYLLFFLLLTFFGSLSRCFSLPLYITSGYYNDPLIFIASLTCFLLFASIRIENRIIIRLISFFAPLTVACLFIHGNPFIEKWFSTFHLVNLLMNT